ncbi:MAG: branched-chain amino acid ABC transporter permease [Alphaproteobacteria bacterium]
MRAARSISRPLLATVLLLVALGVSPLVAEATGKGAFVSVLTRIAIYALAAVSLDFILGFAGLVSLGHAALFGVGAYVVGIASFHAQEETTFLLGIPGSNEALVVWPLAMAVTAFVALLIGMASLRTRGVYFIMITLAFGQMLYFLFVSLPTYGGADGLSLWWGRNVLAGLDISKPLTFFYICFAILVAALAMFSALVNARFGRALAAARQNERRARALGLDPFGTRLAAFVLSGAVVGLAGALLANHVEFVSPDILHWTRSGQLLVMVIIGGIGTLLGGVAGAIALLATEEVLISITEHWQIILGPVLILVVLFARAGLVGKVMARRPGPTNADGKP